MSKILNGSVCLKRRFLTQLLLMCFCFILEICLLCKLAKNTVYHLNVCFSKTSHFYFSCIGGNILKALNKSVFIKNY